MIQEGKWKNNLIVCILAFLGSIGMQGIMAMPASENILYSNSMFSFFVFIALVFILGKVLPAYKSECRRNKVIAIVFSSLLSVALHFGARMESVENVRVTDIGLWFTIVAFAVCFAPIVNSLWNVVIKYSENVIDKSDTKNFKFVQVWLIIFLMWMPTFLAFYPGAFVYDAQDEYIEVISRAFTMHHPLMHVLSLGGAVHLAEYLGLTANVGIATYVLIQMLLMSAVFAYSIICLRNWGVKKIYCVIAMVIYGLFPIFPMYAVCTAKDGLFTTAFFLMVILFIQFVNDMDAFYNTKNMVLFVIASTLMMLLRNNGMYAYVAAIPFIWVICRKQSKKVYKLLILMLLSVVLFFGTNFILKTVTHATDNEHQEMLTVPIQQLARAYTYSKDVFTEEDIECLYEVLPEEYLITYRTRVSDVLKSGFNNTAYEKNPGKYRSLWLRIGLKKPLIYLNAWLGTSYGYWCPDAINNVYGGNQMFTFQYGDSSYFGFETEPPGIRDSKFPILERFYESLSLKLFQQKVPVISMLFSPGFIFWVFTFMLFALIRMSGVTVKNTEDGVAINSDYKRLLPLIPVLLLWLTVLLGPTTLVRYVLIMWFVSPMLLYLLYKN